MDDDNLSPQFKDAVSQVLSLPNKPSQENMLKLYGLYKRVVIGLPESKEPSILNFKENAKWKAWYSMRRYSRKQAELMYIDLVNSLKLKCDI